jgi:hypothetical protein
MSRCLDPKKNGRYPFAYTPSAATDVRKTIARELRRLAAAKEAREASQAEAQTKVKPIKKGAQS